LVQQLKKSLFLSLIDDNHQTLRVVQSYIDS